MKKVLLILAILISGVSLAVRASDLTGKAVNDMQFRQQVVQRLTDLEAFQHKDGQTQWKIGELERKVAGMQKQITILHAKTTTQQNCIEFLMGDQVFVHEKRKHVK